MNRNSLAIEHLKDEVNYLTARIKSLEGEVRGLTQDTHLVIGRGSPAHAVNRQEELLHHMTAQSIMGQCVNLVSFGGKVIAVIKVVELILSHLKLKVVEQPSETILVQGEPERSER